MPDSITLGLDDKTFRRNLKRLSDVEVGRAMAMALNKTAFEVVDAERAEVRRAFSFAGPATKNFLAGRGSFVFNGAKPKHLAAEIFPRKKTEETLRDHQRGVTLLGSDKDHLTYGGKLAVPINPRIRGRSGKVPKKLLPGALLGEKGRGFISGRAILERRGGTPRGRKRGRKAAGRSRVVSVFALVPRAKLAPVFEFYRTAERTARREWPKKAKRAFEKIRFPGIL